MPALPSDVWLQIAASADPLYGGPDISRLGRTCRALLDVADSALLRRGAFLATERHVMSFAAYLAHPSRGGFRVPRVRTLQMCLGMRGSIDDEDVLIGDEDDDADPVVPHKPPSFDARCLGAVADILSRCEAVDTLYFHCPLLDQDERVGRALAGMLSIKKLILQRSHRATYLIPFLASMRSQCTDVTFQDLDDRGYMAPMPATFVLLSFSQSLQSLDVTKPSFLFTLVTYPRLTSLTIFKWLILDIWPVLHCFPALKELSIMNKHPYGDIVETEEEDNAEFDDMDPAARREENIAAFQEEPWTQLERFSGTIETLYQLGISCPIKQVSIYEPPYHPLQLAKLVHCLTQVKPSEVRVMLGKRADEQFEIISAGLVAARTTHLGVVFRDSDPRRARDCMELVLNFARTHNIVFLEITYQPETYAEWFLQLMELQVDRASLPSLFGACAKEHEKHGYLDKHSLEGEAVFLHACHGLTTGEHGPRVFSQSSTLEHLLLRLEPMRITSQCEWSYWNAKRVDGELAVTKTSVTEDIWSKLREYKLF